MHVDMTISELTYLRIGAGDKGTRSDHPATSAQQVVLQAMIGRAHTTHD